MPPKSRKGKAKSASKSKPTKMIPCTFYNHGSCNKGEACSYSHAPDNNSVRDDLGRNVCRYYLTNSCIHGNMCVYSHNVDHMSKRPHSVQHPSGPFSQPFVLVISLMDPIPLLLEGAYSHLLGTLSTKCLYTQVVDSKEALGILWNHKPAAVFIVDPTIAEARNPHPTLVAKLVEYVRGGGTIVFGGMFSSRIAPHDSDAFFKNVWGLDWKMTMCASARSYFALNTRTHPKLLGGLELPRSYNVNAVLLEGVAAQDAVYTPANECDSRQVPVAYAKVGAGYVGYHGAANIQDETPNILLAMLGVPAHDLPAPVVAPPKKTLRTGMPGLSKYQQDVMDLLFPGRDGAEYDSDEEEERMMNGGYTNGDMEELLCQGIKPWDDDW